MHMNDFYMQVRSVVMGIPLTSKAAKLGADVYLTVHVLPHAV